LGRKRTFYKTFEGKQTCRTTYLWAQAIWMQVKVTRDISPAISGWLLVDESDS